MDKIQSCNFKLPTSAQASRALSILLLFITFLLSTVHCQCVSAQAVSWTNAFVNNPPTAGTFTYNGGVTPPTYTISGSGSGASGTDQYQFAYTTTSGNVELYAQLTSQSSSNTNAQTGILFRDSFATTANKASMIVTKSGAITFQYQIPDYPNYFVVSGPTVSLPVYLKLTRNGNTVAGSYSSDAQTWTQVGSYTFAPPLPNKFYAGFIASSTDASLNTAVFKNVVYATSVPQTGSNLALWLRSDKGVSATSGAVGTWADQSGNSLDATQATAANKPSLVNASINNGVLPTITFNGSSKYLSCPAGFANFNNGYSSFVVCKPTNTSSTGTLCAMGNASNSDAIFPQIVNANSKLNVYNSTTASSVATSTNPISASNYQLVEATVAPGVTNSTGTIYTNGTQNAQSTSLQKPVNISRTNNVIGAGIGPASYFNGGIAEILIYAGAVSDSQRAMIESYVLSKYGVGTQPTLTPPVVSPAPGVYLPGQKVTLIQNQDATTYFTTDGSQPSATTSQWIDATPITVSDTVLLKALSVKPFFNNSSILSTTLFVDKTTYSIPRNGLVLWLRADQQVSTSGSNVTTWGDLSSSGNNATQGTASKQPLLIANAVNGLPAVNFTGSKSLQLPSGLADFTAGASIFVLMKPTSVTAGARVLDFGNGATSDNLQLQLPSSTSAALYVYAATPSNITGASAIATSKYNLLEAIHSGSASAKMLSNGISVGSGAINNITNIVRTSNFIGQGVAGANNLNAAIAEIIILNRAVTTAEQAAIEGYFLERYQLLSVNSPAAPKFNMATSTLTAPAQVELEATAEAEIRYTEDGTTPTSSSALYTKGIDVYYTKTIKAIAIVDGVSSSVATATYTLDATRFPPPGSTITPLQLDLQLPNPSIPQDNNQR